MEVFTSLLPIPIINLLVCGLIGQLIGGLVSGYIGGITGTTIETSTTPNQGIWQSSKNGVIIATSGCIIFIILFSLLDIPIFAGFVLGISLGLFAFEALIKHFILRLILYVNGFLPWNYAKFLNYATDSILLQKIGGGYIFTHRLLLEHFAHTPIKGREDLDFEIITSSSLETNNDNQTISKCQSFWHKVRKFFFITIVVVVSIPFISFLIQNISNRNSVVECVISIDRKTNVVKTEKFVGGTDCEAMRKLAEDGKPLPTLSTLETKITPVKSPSN